LRKPKQIQRFREASRKQKTENFVFAKLIRYLAQPFSLIEVQNLSSKGVIEMADLMEVHELLQTLVSDKSISKNVREVLGVIQEELRDGEIAVKIDAAMQKVEDLSLDPNLSPYTRTQIWSLTSLLESAQKRD